MDVTADSATLEELLDGPTLKLPPYQRDLAWDYWKAEGLLDEMISFVRKKKPEKGDRTEVYYLGNLIIQKEGEENNLVDGQQRLSILTIFASALRDVLIENGKFKQASKLHYAVLSNADGSPKYTRKDTEDELTPFRKQRVPEIDLQVNVKSAAYEEEGNSTVVQIQRKEIYWDLTEETTLKIGDSDEEITVKESRNKGEIRDFIVDGNHLLEECEGGHGTVKICSDAPSAITTESTTLEKIYIISKLKFQRFFQDVKYKPEAGRNINTPNIAQAFKFSNEDFPYPVRTRKRDDVTVHKADDATGTFSLLQSWNPHKKGKPLSDWVVRMSPNIAFNLGAGDYLKLSKYKQPQGKPWLADSSVETSLVDLFCFTTFSRTTFARESEALRTFILSNDQNRMVSLHTFDLMNAFTQEIIQNLRVNSHLIPADVVKRCWEFITREIRASKQGGDKLALLNKFLGNYACYISRDEQECTDYVKPSHYQKSTKAFTEIESYIRSQYLDEENQWKEQTAELYAQLFKLAVQFIAIVNPKYYNTKKAGLTTVNVDAVPDGIKLSLNEIDIETLGLLYTIRKKASNDGFTPLLLAISGKFIDDDDLSDRIKDACKAICKILYSFWVLPEDLLYHNEVTEEGDQVRTMNATDITNAFKNGFKEDGDGWLSKSDSIDDENLTVTRFVMEFEKHLPSIVKERKVWPRKRLAGKLGKLVAKSSHENNHNRGFIGMLYEISITEDDADLSKLVSETKDVDMEHFFPKKCLKNPKGWHAKWKERDLATESGRRKHMEMAGNIFVLEHSINNNAHFKVGTEKNKMKRTNELEGEEKSFFNSTLKSVLETRNELRPAGDDSEYVPKWTPEMVRDRTKKIHQKIIEYLDG